MMKPFPVIIRAQSLQLHLNYQRHECQSSLLADVSPDGGVRLTLKTSNLKSLQAAHKADDTFSLCQDTFHLVSLCLEYCGKKKETVMTLKMKPKVIP